MDHPMMLDSDIPPPRVRIGRYPFPRMRVGESFSREVEDQHRVRSAASAYARRHGKRFIVSLVKESGVPKVRCWRLA